MGVGLTFGNFVTGELLELFVAGLEDYELRARRQRKQDRPGVHDRTEPGTAHPAHAAAPARSTGTPRTARTIGFRLTAGRSLAKKCLGSDGALNRSARSARAATGKRRAPSQRAVSGIEAEQFVVRRETVEHSGVQGRRVELNRFVRVVPEFLLDKFVAILFQLHSFHATASDNDRLTIDNWRCGFVIPAAHAAATTAFAARASTALRPRS